MTEYLNTVIPLPFAALAIFAFMPTPSLWDKKLRMLNFFYAFFFGLAAACLAAFLLFWPSLAF